MPSQAVGLHAQRVKNGRISGTRDDAGPKAGGARRPISHARGLLNVELLREPNHHQSNSNQNEEEVRACAVVLRSHFRTAVRLVARPSGPSV
jgi:hypothetical protein